MLLFLLEFLDSLGMKVPAVFSYSSTRMILAVMTTLLFTLLLGPLYIKKLYEMKTGQSIRVEDCPLLVKLHEKKKDTPSMGGILILSSMLLALFLWMDLRSSFTFILFVTTICLGGVGGYDDYLKLKHKNSRGLSAKKKSLMQVILAAVIAIYMLWPAASETIHMGNWFPPPVAKEYIQGASEPIAQSTQEYAAHYYIPFFKDPVVMFTGMGLTLAFFFTIFVVTGSSNAVNLTDGLDGLASGCLIMTSIVFGIVAFLSNNTEVARYLNILYIEGSGEIAIYLFALAGACLGFLWYNGYPAQVFMGDTGSLALGGIIGVAAVLLRREVLFALVGGVFVAEAASVILQVLYFKMTEGRRIFLCSPLHHHFEYKGWPETKVVMRFWIVAFILAMLGIISLKFQ